MLGLTAPRVALTGTIITILTLARPMAITDLPGSQVEYLSVLALGMAGAAAGAMAGMGEVVGATVVRAGATVEATTVDAGSSVGEDTWAASMA